MIKAENRQGNIAQIEMSGTALDILAEFGNLVEKIFGIARKVTKDYTGALTLIQTIVCTAYEKSKDEEKNDTNNEGDAENCITAKESK